MPRFNYTKPGFLFAVFFIALSLNLSACNYSDELGGGNLKVIQEKTFDTTPGKDFVLKASSGDVIITTSNSPQVYIKILGNERSAKVMEFNYDTSGNGVIVTAEKKDKLNIFNWFNNAKLRFEVILPSNYNAKVSSSGGDIKLSNLNGEVSLHSSGGDISTNNTQSSLSATTSGGDIKCENNSGPMILKTSGGNVTCLGFSGNLDASTSGGNISINGKDSQIRAHTSGGEIELTYSGDNKGIDLSSSGGSIKLSLPANFNASAELSTSGGSVKCAFGGNNAKVISESKFIADINNGGNQLLAKTSGGDIDVAKQ
ncbi:MAG: DUF4097 family beta strand repeat-containing protein [Ignavibacteriaceae bacterium]